MDGKSIPDCAFTHSTDTMWKSSNEVQVGGIAGKNCMGLLQALARRNEIKGDGDMKQNYETKLWNGKVFLDH